jgi:hypothetical protein
LTICSESMPHCSTEVMGGGQDALGGAYIVKAC